MLDLFPDSTEVVDGELRIGGLGAAELAERFGTPVVVYCERTLRERARAYRRAAPDALVVYGTKAFPNVSVLRLFAEEGLGADVSTLGELQFALRAGVPGAHVVVHGNNKSLEELEAAAAAGVGYLVLDALDEIELAATAGVRQVLVRVTPGIDVDTHTAIRTAHAGSKFGLPPGQALEAVGRARAAGLEPVGLHVHIGSQLLDTGAAGLAADWLAGFAAECASELDWTPSVVDLGGGLGIRYAEDDPDIAVDEFVGELLGRLRHTWEREQLPAPAIVLEPGRSLVGRAGVTFYRVGAVKRATETTTYVAVDGGMSDNPRPQLYGARFSALLGCRADEPPTGNYTICGKHCESGDVLIDRAHLPEPRRGDLLAVPATGAYTLGMGSNYNALPRPAAVLVEDGEARVIRRRETIEDLLALEA